MYLIKMYWSILLFCSAYASVYAHTPKDPEQIFTSIYEQNLWNDPESVSGEGSTMKATDLLRAQLPLFIKNYAITSILDVPCGDFNWLSTIDFGNCLYTGIDIVKGLVDSNNRLYACSSRVFKQGNAIIDDLPKVDLIMCRDMLVHFDLASILKTLKNFKKSGSKYLLVTVQPYVKKNKDIKMGEWRPINLQKAPFNFPAPLYLLSDKGSKRHNSTKKYLALWLLEDLPL